jgi:AbrB family transcriptional regulator, stage V sporulation protein T
MTKPAEVWEGRVAAGGRVVLPADLRRALGVRVGDAVFFRHDGDRIVIETHQESVRRAQALVRQIVRGFTVEAFQASRPGDDRLD